MDTPDRPVQMTLPFPTLLTGDQFARSVTIVIPNRWGQPIARFSSIDDVRSNVVALARLTVLYRRYLRSEGLTVKETRCLTI